MFLLMDITSSLNYLPHETLENKSHYKRLAHKKSNTGISSHASPNSHIVYRDDLDPSLQSLHRTDRRLCTACKTSMNAARLTAPRQLIPPRKLPSDLILV